MKALAWSLALPALTYVRKARQRTPGAVVHVVAFSVLFLTMLNESLVGAGALDNLYLIDVGFLAAVLSVCGEMTFRVTSDARRLRQLSENLAREVDERTRELMLARDNLVRSERGEVTKGTIEFKGERVDGLTPNDLVRRGCIQVMEGRHCFGHLTIEENLLTGAFTRRDGRGGTAAALERVYAYFPRLKERRLSQAGYTSGGEQQMCAIGRALMSRPETVLLDEPSMGLAPQLVEEIFEIVRSLNENEGVSFLLAEQNTNVALRFAHHGYILESGRVVMDGPAAELRENPDVKEFYLGLNEVGGRKSYRDTKRYRRRKRWLS